MSVSRRGFIGSLLAWPVVTKLSEDKDVRGVAKTKEESERFLNLGQKNSFKDIQPGPIPDSVTYTFQNEPPIYTIPGARWTPQSYYGRIDYWKCGVSMIRGTAVVQDVGNPRYCGPPNKVKQRGVLLGLSLCDVVMWSFDGQMYGQSTYHGGTISILAKGTACLPFSKNAKIRKIGQPLWCGPHGELRGSKWLSAHRHCYYEKPMGYLKSWPDEDGFALVEIDV